jgi:hypothetical protein
MVSKENWTQQDLAFKLADGLDSAFNVQYAQTDVSVNAYEIESTLSSIMESFGLQLVISDRDKFNSHLGNPFDI